MIKLNIELETENSDELEMALVSLRKFGVMQPGVYCPNPAWDPRILETNGGVCRAILDDESKKLGAAPKKMDDQITFGASSL